MKKITPEEIKEYNDIRNIVMSKLKYIPSIPINDYEKYFEAKKSCGSDINAMADFIYKKYYEPDDNIEYYTTGKANLFDFAVYVKKITGIDVNQKGMLRELRSMYGNDISKWIEYANAHKDIFVQTKTPDNQVTVNAPKEVKPTPKPVASPKPSFQSTGNKDFDDLLILRANMSCVYGFAKAKAEEIRKTTEEQNKYYAENTKYWKNIDERKRKIEQEKRYKRESEATLASWKYKKEHSILFKKKEAEKNYNLYLETVKYHEKLITDTEKSLDAYCKLNGKKWTELNNKIARCDERIKNNHNDIKKAFSEFERQTFCLHPNDYKYLDYIIYLFSSHRATSIKEALNELDAALRHNELMNSINRLSNQITQSIQYLSQQIVSATASINANLSYLNASIDNMNQNISYLREEVNYARDENIEQQAKTRLLIEEGNRIASLNYEATKNAASTLESIRLKMI